MTDSLFPEHSAQADSKHFTCCYTLELNRIALIAEYQGETFFPLFGSGCDGLQASLRATDCDINDELPVLNSCALQLGLVLADTEERGAVCYAYQNRELRDEFKQVFSRIDVLHYGYAFLYATDCAILLNESSTAIMADVPYPTDTAIFWKLVRLGRTLASLNPIHDPTSEQGSSTFPIAGDHQVKYGHYREGRVAINPTQYFENVPESCWNFNCFGYFPAQEWFKNYYGANLDESDILHYQVLINAIQHTIRVRNEVDQLLIDCTV